MTVAARTHRLVIAGASSLLGNELKDFLWEGHFAAADVRLVDEDLLVGTLTEARGEPAVIQGINDDSFSRADAVFLAGSAAFSKQCYPAARQSGAAVIDLSSALAEIPEARSSIPRLDAVLAGPQIEKAPVYLSPSGPAIICSTLAAALSTLGATRLYVVLFHPVSESGRAGVEELESQTKQLLSFQPLSQTTFDTQVAFTLLDRYGESSAPSLCHARRRILDEVRTYLGTRAPVPAIQVLHAPVFHGNAFTVYVELPEAIDENQLTQSLTTSGMVVQKAGEQSPSNVTVAGESEIHAGIPRADELRHGAWFLWGAADNLRLPAANAVAIAEGLFS